MSVSGPKLGRTLLTVPKVRKIFENFKASPVSEKFWTFLRLVPRVNF